MKSLFVVDGEARLRQSKEFQARTRELSESVRTRYATELANAGFFWGLVLRWHMAAEIRREEKKLLPSRHALYTSKVAIDDSNEK